MPKIDIESVAVDTSVGYPPPLNKAVEGRSRKRLGNAAGLSQFGVNLCRLKPGAASSQRHWQHNEDEFVYMLEGEVALCEDAGETVLKPGDAAGWKAGVEVGTRAPSEKVTYPDVDMLFERVGTSRRYTRKSGEPYPA
jgi:uncharacterized cupin superfamily protein